MLLAKVSGKIALCNDASRADILPTRSGEEATAKGRFKMPLVFKVGGNRTMTLRWHVSMNGTFRLHPRCPDHLLSAFHAAVVVTCCLSPPESERAAFSSILIFHRLLSSLPQRPRLVQFHILIRINEPSSRASSERTNGSDTAAASSDAVHNARRSWPPSAGMISFDTRYRRSSGLQLYTVDRCACPCSYLGFYPPGYLLFYCTQLAAS